jgi:hypothetical protein
MSAPTPKARIIRAMVDLRFMVVVRPKQFQLLRSAVNGESRLAGISATRIRTHLFVREDSFHHRAAYAAPLAVLEPEA